MSRKLAPKFIGPLKVIQVISPVAYRLELPANLEKLHNVFHVSLLKPFYGNPLPPRPPIFTTEYVEEFEVEKLLAHRTVRGKRQYLVQWKGYPTFEATWEPESNLENAATLLKKYKKEYELV